MILAVPLVDGHAPAPVFIPPVNLLMARFEELAEAGICRIVEETATFLAGGSVYHIPRMVVRPDDRHRPIHVGIFTGLRGNMEGGLALLHFLQSLEERPWRAAGYELWIYPLCNPTGHEDGRVTNRRGAALDSDFWKHSPEPEIMLLERELQERQFQLVVTLHTEAAIDQFSASSSGGRIAEQLAEGATSQASLLLGAPSATVPWPAGALSAPPQSGGRNLSLRFGAPRTGSMRQRVAALDAALGSVLASARHYLDPR